MPSTERLWRDRRSGARMTERPRSQEPAASQAVRVVDWLEAGGAWVVLGAAMVLYALFVLWATRGTTMFVDEQTLFQTDAGLHPSVLFAPVNGHLILWERLLYAVDFKLFGASFVLPRIVEAVSVVAVVAAFFALVKRRIGAAAALAPALLLLLFGTAWENDLSISGISTVDAVAAGLAAFLLLEGAGPAGARDARPRRSWMRDAGACVLLIVAVYSWTVGVAFAVGALVLILLQPKPWRRAWVAVVPLVFYGAWLLWVRLDYVPAHGEVQNIAASNILLAPNYIADEASAVMGALGGLNYGFQPSYLAVFTTTSDYGPVLAVAVVAVVLISIRRGSRRPPLWAFICTLLAFWVALALAFGQGRDPSMARYVYAGGVLVMLIIAEAVRGVRLSPLKLGVLYAITALAIVGNLARLRDGERFYRSFGTTLRAQLTGLEIARDHVSPAFRLAAAPSLEVIQAGPYLAAVSRIGSPAYSQAQLVRAPEGLRHAADATLVAALGISLSPSGGEPVGACRRVTGGAAGAPPTVLVRPPGIALRSPAAGQVALRRFASSTTVPVGDVAAGETLDLRIPSDRSSVPWHASVGPPSSSVTVCPLPGAG
jgi:hypothetical protein